MRQRGNAVGEVEGPDGSAVGQERVATSGAGIGVAATALALGLVVVVALGAGWLVPGGAAHSSASPTIPAIAPGTSVGTPPAAGETFWVPTPRPTPTPRATPTIVPGAIFATDLLAEASWSYDGRLIAVVSRGAGVSWVATILDPSGAVADRFDASWIAWTGTDGYVALADADATGLATGSPAFQGIVGSSWYSSPGNLIYRQIIGGSGGWAALQLATNPGSDQYQVLGLNGAGEFRDGVPIAFSPDGSLLAVVHYPVACCAGGDASATQAPAPPTLDIEDVASGTSLATSSEIEWAYGARVSFSPDSRYVAFVMYPAAGTTPERIGVIDIQANRLWVIGAQTPDSGGPMTPYWTDSSELVVPGWSAGSVPRGLPVTATFDAAGSDVVAVSSAGLIARASSGSASIAISDRAGMRSPERLELPLPVSQLSWSPDGTRLLAVGIDGRSSPGVAELFLLTP
jgi:hypothetical protein